MKKIAVVLCGCGAMDGSEIHESVFTLLAIDELGAEYKCFALDKPQARVMNTASGQELNESRNQLVEAARISRGKINKLQELKSNDFDALILPGGFGAAFNLCTFAKDKAQATVEPEVERIVREFYDSKKPIGAICIAPTIIALVLGKAVNPTLTAGEADDTVAVELEKLGATTQGCKTSDCVIDRENKIVSTPAYMNAKRISEVREGIAKLVKAVLEMG
ncbi:MAG: isoprenoid biosynthesis glyoxalase ElbB [Candidatus Caenarcaniphilales bacterium]|nr:isoprenoid biosynthesis glyoxalase ElbB [Candidatus Caenarcaniphilales bacterium]